LLPNPPYELAIGVNLNRIPVGVQLIIQRLNSCDETIAFRRDRYDELWRIGIIIQRPPDLAYGGVDAALAVDEDTLTLDSINNFSAGDELVATFHQKTQQFERNAFEMDDGAATAELMDAPVEFEILESAYFW
jgi:hypothetical protein